MEISLKGKQALVGGSTAGIGKAIAMVLANCGASVTLMARNEDKLKQVMAELNTKQGQQHSYLVTDFYNFEQHRSKMSDFFKAHQVDILVNNTQGPAAGTVFTKSSADYQEAFDLLFQHAVHTSMLAIPHMQAQGFGRIINVSSMTVKEPVSSLLLSNTMRTALHSWAKSLSVAVAADGITVNTVLTGSFDTERLNSLMATQASQLDKSLAEIKASRLATIPVNRLGEPAEYGYLVAFLASPYAAFLNGVAIPLDGGASVSLF